MTVVSINLSLSKVNAILHAPLISAHRSHQSSSLLSLETALVVWNEFAPFSPSELLLWWTPPDHKGWDCSGGIVKGYLPQGKCDKADGCFPPWLICICSQPCWWLNYCAITEYNKVAAILIHLSLLLPFINSTPPLWDPNPTGVGLQEKIICFSMDKQDHTHKANIQELYLERQYCKTWSYPRLFNWK